MDCLKMNLYSDNRLSRVSLTLGSGASTGLGSGTWITYTDGSAIQHLYYLPFGEEQIDQRLTGFNSRYTFSAKEKDIETGYSYFGARYYTSDLSIWLSVDPMSDKYPSMTPYNYCNNNPVILVDPDGMDVEIGGDAQQAYYKEVKNGAKSLGISVKMDKNGLLSAQYKGKGEISSEGQQVLDAINDKNVKVEINATKSDYADDKPFFGGAFMGNKLHTREDGSVGATGYQTVNPKDLRDMDNYYGQPGRSSLHEMTESFQGGLISIKEGVSSGPKGSANSVYSAADKAAIQPSGKVNYYGIDTFGNVIPKGAPASNAHSIGFAYPKANYFVKTVPLRK